MNWAACVSAVVCRYPWYPGQYWTVPLNTSVLFQQRTSAALATSPFLVLVKSMLLLNVSVRIALVWQRWKSKCTIMEKNPKVSRRQSSCLFYTNHPKHFHSENLNGSLFSFCHFLEISRRLSTLWILFTLSFVLNVIFASCLIVVVVR